VVLCLSPSLCQSINEHSICIESGASLSIRAGFGCTGFSLPI
jgi:hypothetical protein